MQRVTRYPLLLSRLVKVTPGGHSDKEALQESREMLEQGLDTMNQETNRDTGTTKLWRRISMINTTNRRTENQIDFLGSTTWGVRKVNIRQIFQILIFRGNCPLSNINCKVKRLNCNIAAKYARFSQNYQAAKSFIENYFRWC